MHGSRLSKAIGQFSVLQRSAEDDGALLERFIHHHDEAAFEALLRRHGRMVLGVCRRLLRNAADADDAFQATFFILAKRAASVQPRNCVGNWLYGVAVRTAMEARRAMAKRRAKEAAARPMERMDERIDELREVLDVELARLSDKHRAVIVLCDLEGKSRKEVARLLNCPEGTVASRLTRARAVLAQRLARHGFSVSAGAVAGMLLQEAAAGSGPLPAVSFMAKAAIAVAGGKMLTAGGISIRVVALAEGAMKTMFLMKLKSLTFVVLVAVAGFIGVGAAGWTYGGVEPTTTGDLPPATRAARDELDALRLEVEALRKLLNATRERVATLENQVQGLRAGAGARQLVITQTGPLARYVDRPAVWEIHVANMGGVPLSHVVVSDQLPPELRFTSATEGGQFTNGRVSWNLGTLQPRQQKSLQLTTKCMTITPRALNVAIATADPGIRAQAEAGVEILGLPAFRLEVSDLNDPVELGAKTTYKIEVRNQGSLPGRQVQIMATVPKEMEVLGGDGPTKPFINGQDVLFPPVEYLPEKQTLTYSVEVRALQPGDVRFTARLFSATLGREPVVEQESTTIYAPPPDSRQRGKRNPAPARPEPGEKASPMPPSSNP